MNVRDWFEQELARIREAEVRAIAEREAQAQEAQERANALLEAQQREEQRRTEEALALQYAQEERERAESEKAAIARAEAERQAALLEEARQAAREAEAEAAEIKAQEVEVEEVEVQAARAQAQLVARAAERAAAEAAERAARLEIETRRIEAERVEAERVEAERVEAERVEAERVEAERVEAERVEAERVEAERVEAERVEAALRAASTQLAAEQLAAEQLAAEQLAAEQLAAQRRAKEEAEAQKLLSAQPAGAEFSPPEPALWVEPVKTALAAPQDVPTFSSITASEPPAETDEVSQSEPPLIVPLVAAYPIALAPESYERDVLLGVADLHCHLLPAWDDGARDLETSLEMVRRAGTWGCEAIVVTPHVGKLFNFNLPPSQEIGAAVAALQEKVAASSQKTRLVPGAEIALSSPVLLERILNEPELSVGGLGRHALIEPPGRDWPEWMEMAALQILQSGVTPILAHPERFPAVQRNPAILERLVNTGALVQITADAIVGNMGRHSKRCAEALFGLGLVALIASDAHDTRATLPSEVADEVKAMVGIDAARRILRDNPLAILAGEVAFAPLIAPPVVEEAPRGLLSSLWSRH